MLAANAQWGLDELVLHAGRTFDIELDRIHEIFERFLSGFAFRCGQSFVDFLGRGGIESRVNAGDER